MNKDTTDRGYGDSLLATKAANFLKDRKSLATYLNELMLEDHSPHLISGAIGDFCRHHGLFLEVAEKSGLAREGLYKALRNTPDAKPAFGTILKVLHALDIELVCIPLPANTIKL